MCNGENDCLDDFEILNCSEDDYSCDYDGNAAGILDCVTNECVPNWVADGFCDGDEMQFGVNLCCYNLDGGDCLPQDCIETGECPGCNEGVDSDNDGICDDVDDCVGFYDHWGVCNLYLIQK